MSAETDDLCLGWRSETTESSDKRREDENNEQRERATQFGKRIKRPKSATQKGWKEVGAMEEEEYAQRERVCRFAPLAHL